MIKNDLNAKMSLKLIILLFLSLKFSHIYGDEDSGEGKYIDLLTEKEKKEFLEKIARRILEEIKSTNTEAKSGELPESQLNQHQDYVAKILKEEKERFQKNHNVTVPDKPMLRTTDEKDDHQTLDKEKSGSNEGNKTENLDGVDKTVIEGEKEQKKIQKNKLETSNETLIQATTPIIQLHSHEVKIVSKNEGAKNENYTIEITIEDSKENNSKEHINSKENKNGKPNSVQIERQIPVMIEYASDNPERSELRSAEHNSGEKSRYFEKSSLDDLDNTRRHTNVSTTESPVSVTQKIRINDISNAGTTEKPVKRRKFKVLRKINRNLNQNDNSSDRNNNNDKKIKLADVGASTLKLYTLNEKKVKRSYTTEQLTTPMMKIKDSSVSATSTTMDKKEESNSTQIDTPNDITNIYNEHNVTSKVISQTPKNSNSDSSIDANQTTKPDKTVTKATKLSDVNETIDKSITVAIKEISATVKSIIKNSTETRITNTTEKVETVTTEKIVTSTTESLTEVSSSKTTIPSQTESYTEVTTETFIAPLSEKPVTAKYVNEEVTVATVTNAYKNPTRTPNIVSRTPKTRTIIAELTETEKLEEDRTTYTDLPTDLILRNLDKDSGLLNIQNLEEVSLYNKHYNLDENGRINEQDDTLKKGFDDNDITDSKLFHALQKQYNDKNNITEYKVYEVLNEEEAMKKITGKKTSEVKSLRTKMINNDDEALRTQNEGLQEQPYYIPVYNYAPENAYFSAYNKFGPNSEDSRKRFQVNIDLNTMEVNHKSAAYPKAREPKKTNYNDIPALSQILARPNYYGLYTLNPLDTIDYDNSYFDAGNFDRSFKPIFRSRNKKKNRNINSYQNNKDNDGLFPNSNEADHPINWMKSGPFKSQVSAARQLMYKHQHYGTSNQFLPTTTTTTTPDPPVTVKDNHKKKMKKAKRTNVDITLDKLIARLSQVNKEEVVKPTKKLKPKKTIMQKVVGYDYFWNRDPTPSKYKNKDLLISADKLIKYRTSLDSLEELVNDFLRNNKDEKDAQKNDQDGKIKVDSAHLQMIADMSDAKDSVPAVLALQTLMRSKKVSLEPYIKVIKDQVKIENKDLENYDWLSTAVDIQAALRKLQNLTQAIQNATKGVPSEDLELYYYLVYLYTDAKLRLKEEAKQIRAKQAISKKSELNRIQMSSKNNHFTALNFHPHVVPDESSLLDGFKPMEGYQDEKIIQKDDVININKFRRINDEELIPLLEFAVKKEANEFLKKDSFENKIEEFGDFLTDFENMVYDLHNAIKHVALISKNKTSVYKNLKDLYLRNLTNKEAIELLLHLEGTKLLELIEDSAKKGLNDNYLGYMQYNEKDVQSTLDELIIVLRLMKEFDEVND